MDIEQQQSELIENLVKEATTLPSSSLPTLITQATSHPSLFAFSDLLSLPALLQLQGTENSGYLQLLRLFAYGTWLDYKSNAFTLPKLLPEQILKLKQLTVLSLVHSNKELPYDELLKELELANVRELEDFLINECMYAGIVKGKLNQSRRCFEVQYAAGRDLIEGELGSMIETLNKWQVTSENMLSVIQEKIEWAIKMSVTEKNHQKEVQDKIEQTKNSLKYSGGHNLWRNNDGLLDYEGGLFEHENFLRSKRRRSPAYPRQSRQGDQSLSP